MIQTTICYKCNCERCGYSWITRDKVIPMVCAGCRSRVWNKKKEKKEKKNKVTMNIKENKQTMDNEKGEKHLRVC